MKLQPEKHIPIVIVGAGPTGLTMAAFLAELEVPFRIIEKNKHASSKSKAMAVQARTLEIFAQLGLAEKMVSRGLPAPAISIYTEGQLAGTVDLDDGGSGRTPFPYLLILPQDQTEAILIEHLEKQGVQIEWHTELVGLQDDEEGAFVHLKNSQGEQEVIRTDYVFGADGAHSFVRHQMPVDFVGGAYEESFMLTDVEVEWDLNPKGFGMFMEKEFFMIYFKLDSRYYRLITLLPPELNERSEQTEVHFETLKELIEKNLSIPIKLHGPKWTSHYKVHHRCVENFRSGSLFLGGDSGHIHSPAGGQGMNTGIQDAHNLAWKLAWVVKNNLKPALLDTYQQERWPVAQKLVNVTDKAFQGMIGQSTFAQWRRVKMLPFFLANVNRFSFFRRFLFRFVSQTSINYEKQHKGYDQESHKLLKAGRRFPYCETNLANGQNLFDLLDYTSFHVLQFGEIDEAKVASYLADCPQPVKLHKIGAEEKAIFDFYQLEKPALVLVRPDMYIA